MTVYANMLSLRLDMVSICLVDFFIYTEDTFTTVSGGHTLYFNHFVCYYLNLIAPVAMQYIYICILYLPLFLLVLIFPATCNAHAQ